TQGMPGQGIPGGYPGAPVPQPPKKKNKAGIIIAAILVPLALVGVGIAVFGGDDSKELEVGDCLRNKGSDNSPDLERLDCDNSEASHKVLKKVNGITGNFACTSVPGTEAVFTLQEGSTRFTLCLGPAGD
ncbi:LppU/SCO3897 family protein, partial [Streptomyces alkaliterrae]